MLLTLSFTIKTTSITYDDLFHVQVKSFLQQLELLKRQFNKYNQFSFVVVLQAIHCKHFI